MIAVLYADNEEGLDEPGKLFLEKSGQGSTDPEVSAAEALQKIKSMSYNTIISYFQIPGIDWIAFLKIICPEFHELPFVVFFCKTKEDVAIEAIDIGTDLFVVQVFNLTNFREKEKILEQSEHWFSDINNYLPDATRAINPTCIVIASNKAIDEITGVKA